MSQSIYKVRHITDKVYEDDWYDGVRAAFYSVDGLIHLTGGWNGNKNPTMVSRHYTLNTKTFEIKRLPDAPWSPRHTHGFGEAGKKLWVWGWSLTGKMDLWSWTYSEGWTQHIKHWDKSESGPLLTHFNSCAYRDRYLYVANGFDAEKYYSSIWRVDIYNIPAGFVWIADMPPFLQKACSGNLFDWKGDLAHAGGGEFGPGFATQPLLPYISVGLTKDEGRTWTEVTKEPLLDSFVWGDIIANGKIAVGVSGSDKNNKMDVDYPLIITDNLLNWNFLDKNLPFRHATAKAVDDEGNIHFIMGNGRNDWHMIKKIADTKQFYE